MVYCIDCGKERDQGAAKRCWNCHVINLKKNRKSDIICKDCGLQKPHYGHGQCRQCYQKEYTSTPAWRKKHAAEERKRRAKGLHLESERKRAKTERRKIWKRKYQQEYYKKNRKHLLAYQRAYRGNTRQQTQYKREKRERLRNLPSTLTPKEWQQIVKTHNYSCYYCKKKTDKLEADHMLPAIHGGGYTKENLVPACGRCNRRKSTKTVEEYREYLLSLDEEPMF